MAYDAVSAPPPPPAKAAAPAAKADAGASQGAGQGAAQSPFGALMAILDAGQDDAPAAPQDPKAAQTASTQGAQATKPAKTDAKADTKTDAKDADADKTADAAPAQGQTDPAALMAGLLVPQTTQPAAPTEPQTAQAAAGDGKTAPTSPVVPDATLQLATAQTKPDPKLDGAKLADPKTMDAKAAGATPPAPAKPDAETPPAPTNPIQQLTDAAKPKTADVAASTEQRPTTGDVRRADARTDQTRDPSVNGQAHQPQAGSQDAKGQGAGDRPHDRSAERQVASTEGKPATTAAPEIVAQAAAPEAAAPANALAAAPLPQQLASATPAMLVQTATPVRGSPETVAQLAAQMIQRLEGQSTQFDLALNPQNLGRVDVRIEIDHRGGLKARMAFDSPEAAKQLSGQQGELRAALEQAGFDLPDGALTFDVSSGGQQQGGGFADGRDFGSARMFQAVAEAADPTPATPSYFTRAAASGVDIRI